MGVEGCRIMIKRISKIRLQVLQCAVPSIVYALIITHIQMIVYALFCIHMHDNNTNLNIINKTYTTNWYFSVATCNRTNCSVSFYSLIYIVNQYYKSIL